LSNSDTGKIAMLVESTSASGVESAMEKFGSCLQKIQNVTMDMSPTYALVFNDLKMLRKHETQIVNYFRQGATNAKSERLNGKIQRFITQNYGLKDKDFFLYRTAGYFS
jgi:transposase